MNRQQVLSPSSVLHETAAWDIVVPQRGKLLDHLEKVPRLRRFVAPICQAVREHFGPNFELSLEVYRDPEIDDEYLTLYVRQGEYDLTLMDRIDAVREELASVLNRVSGALLITTDFCPPRGNMANGAKRVRRTRVA